MQHSKDKTDKKARQVHAMINQNEFMVFFVRRIPFALSFISKELLGAQ